MTDFMNFKMGINSFLQELDERLKAAEENFPKETQCAVIIQKAYRGHTVRLDIFMRSLAANEIQRVFRGHVGRNKAHHEFELKMTCREKALFSYFAVQLQRTFRAYYSRKYIFDYEKRKREVQHVIKQGEVIRKTMEIYAIEQRERMNREEEEKKVAQMNECAKNLHHLVSTRHIRGIYNPDVDLVDAPTFNQMPIETHIRGVVKDLLKSRGIAKRGLVADMNGTKRVPLKGLKNRLSLQASSPYDAIHQEKLKEQELERLIAKQKGTFSAGGKTDLINRIEAPLAVGDTFIDAWANPMTMRGVPESQEQLKESCRTGKALFTKNFGIPFVSRTGGNKSTTLANDLFDVIAEAEVSGGAVKRHLGRSTRFGLPDSADLRENRSFLPCPPTLTKSSMTKSLKPNVKVLNPITHNSSSYFDDGDSSSDDEAYIPKAVEA